MEPIECNSFTGSGTIVSEWYTATVTTRTPGRPTTRIVLATARSRPSTSTEHTVCGKRERRCSDRQWRKRCGRRRARAICADIRRACSSDTRPAGAHVRRGSLGPARLTSDDQKRGSGPGTIIRRHRPRYHGTGHAAARVRGSSLSPFSFHSLSGLAGTYIQRLSRHGPIRAPRIQLSPIFTYPVVTMSNLRRRVPERLLRLVTRRCSSCFIRRRGTRCRKSPRRSCKQPSSFTCPFTDGGGGDT
jgi:hypothetical protein